MRSESKNGYIQSDIKVNTPHGASQTIHSDTKLLNRNHETFVVNQNYFEKKKSIDVWTPLGWNIDRRRQQEWLR